MKERVQLTPETIAWAEAEGTEIFSRSRSLREGDTNAIKVRNSTLGAFGQQVFIDRTNGHRVTKAEVPGFWYDVTCSDEMFKAYTGFSLGLDHPARVEIKCIRMVNRSGKWVSLYENFLKHAIESAKRRRFDYLVVYGVSDQDEAGHSADVELLAVVSAEVFDDGPIVYCFPRSTYWNDTDPRTQMRYFNRGNIHADNLGKIFV